MFVSLIHLPLVNSHFLSFFLIFYNFTRVYYYLRFSYIHVMYFDQTSHLLEHGWPSRGYILEETLLSLPQLPLTAETSQLGFGLYRPVSQWNFSQLHFMPLSVHVTQLFCCCCCFVCSFICFKCKERFQSPEVSLHYITVLQAKGFQRMLFVTHLKESCQNNALLLLPFLS